MKQFYLICLLQSADAKLFDESGNEITEEQIKQIKQIKNEIYIIKFNKTEEIIEINPYDYVMEFLLLDLKLFTYEEIKYKMKDIKNYSLQKCALNDDIYKTEETNLEFKKYLKEIMNHDILRKTFVQIKDFSDKNYPLDNQKLIKQIKTNLLFIPFPTPHLSGLTLKKFGFILINTKRFYDDIENEDNRILRYIKKL